MRLYEPKSRRKEAQHTEQNNYKLKQISVISCEL